jgi:hypothetical protein
MWTIVRQPFAGAGPGIIPAMNRILAAALAGGMLVAACSPTFDWRETRLAESPLLAMFPCRPDRHERAVALPAAPRATMRMAVCAAGGATFAFSAVDLPDPTAAPAALRQLRTAALANVQAEAAPQTEPWRLAGMTPSDEALRVVAHGKLPDGTPVVEHAAFFAQGAHVYQASVIGVKPPVDAVETFFSGLRFVP